VALTGQRFAYGPRVDNIDDDDSLSVNCGRCGKPLIVRLRDVLDKRTIDCSQCENGLLSPEKNLPLGSDGGPAAARH
jgi:hypothetical protein